MALSRPNSLTVLFLISSEGFFGAENMLVSLATSLGKLGCRCIVGVFSDSRFQHTEIADRARAQGLHVELVPCNGRCDWHTVICIRSLLVEHQVDILHPHGYKADLYSYAAAWRHRVAIVATCHNWPNRLWSMRAYAALDRWVMRGFDRIVVVSDLVAQTLRRSGIRAAKVQTIFNGVQTDLFRSAHPTLRDELTSDGEAVVGFVGRFVPDKGGEILLRAAQRVLHAQPRTRFVFVGDGPCRLEWESLAAQLDIRGQVSFEGVREDMPGVYASLDVLVLPTLCEAMPMCLLEAMAAGKPVIASSVGAVPKLVVPQHTGALVQPADVEGLSAAIIQMLADPEQARRLGENGYNRASERFSADSMATRYLELYTEVTDSREPAGKRAMAWGFN